MAGRVGISAIHLPPGSPGQTLIRVDMLLILTAVLAGAAATAGLIDRMPRQLGLEDDKSFANLWNYLKWAGISLLFLQLWRVHRQPVHAAAGLVFLGVFLDDAFELHEWANRLLAKGLGGLAPHRVGVGLLAGLAVGASGLMALAWRRTGAAARAGMVPILWLTAALIGIGGGLDLLQSEVRDALRPAVARVLGFGIGLFEDGMDLIFASLILMATLSLRRAVVLQG